MPPDTVTGVLTPTGTAPPPPNSSPSNGDSSGGGGGLSLAGTAVMAAFLGLLTALVIVLSAVLLRRRRNRLAREKRLEGERRIAQRGPEQASLRGPDSPRIHPIAHSSRNSDAPSASWSLTSRADSQSSLLPQYHGTQTHPTESPNSASPFIPPSPLASSPGARHPSPGPERSRQPRRHRPDVPRSALSDTNTAPSSLADPPPPVTFTTASTPRWDQRHSDPVPGRGRRERGRADVPAPALSTSGTEAELRVTEMEERLGELMERMREFDGARGRRRKKRQLKLVNAADAQSVSTVSACTKELVTGAGEKAGMEVWEDEADKRAAIDALKAQIRILKAQLVEERRLVAESPAPLAAFRAL